jgi:hypothetical protein
MSDDDRTRTITSPSFDSSEIDDPGGGGGGVLSLPGWITDIRGVLEAFGRSPAGFIVGAVLSVILGGIETILTALLDAIILVFLGSDPGRFAAPNETLGLADIPAFAAGVLIDGTEPVGDAAFATIETLIGAAADVAASAGPAAPIVVAAIIGVVAIVGAVTIRTVIDVVGDAVPGLGGLIE